MNAETWLTDPESAYVEWQRAEATGADRRAFSERSIVQHRSMFLRFHRYLTGRRSGLATFGADHLDQFFADLDGHCAPGTSTRLRYLKLIDRLVRHLVALELRSDNPAAAFLANERWPEDEPTPAFLDEASDARLQLLCAARAFDSFKDLRNAAIVALLLASGITSAELRALVIDDLEVTGPRMRVFVKKHGARIARRVPIEAFAADVLRLYRASREKMPCREKWLFVATASGSPMKTDRLGVYVRNALREANLTAQDESPRLLRNTFCRRHLASGKTNEQVSSLLGLSSHRTVIRLRETLASGDEATSPGDTLEDTAE